MNKQARQLVEHISDQYVLLAADSAQAFAAAAQKKKKNRAKVFAIAAAAAAMYIIITVSLIIGALTPPDTPEAPPDDGSGTQEQPEQPGEPDDPSQHEPEIHLPDAEFFQQHLSGFWEISDILTSPWPDTGIPDSVIVLNFQSDGRAYVFEEIDGKSTLGKYSVADDHIQIYTLDSEQQWVLYGKMKISTQSNQTHLYAGGLIFDRIEDINITNLLIEGTLELTETVIELRDFYIGSMIFDTHAFDFDHIAPVYSELTSMKFDSAPFFSLSGMDSVDYKLYDDKHLHLLDEGSYKTNGKNDILYIDTLEENGLYYVDLSCTYTTSNFIQKIVIHYYLVIQIDEIEYPVPDTPPTLQADPPPTLERLSEDECRKHLLGIWSSGELGEDDTYPIWYVFSPDGYFNIYDAEKNEGQTGVYSFDGSNIGLWLPDENGKWYQTDTQMTLVIHSITQKELHVKDNSGTTRIYQSTTYDHYPILYLGTFDAPMSSTLLQRQTFYQMYLGEIHTNQGASATLDLPPLNVLEGIQPINITDLTPLTEFYISISAEDYSASFIVYVPMGNDTYRIRNTGEINLQKGDYRSYSLADIFDISRASAPGIYYVDIRFECSAPGDVGTFVWHYYVALQNGEEKVDEPVTPPTYDEPKINLPEPLMFVQHLQSYWTSDWAIGWGNINYIFNFQLDGRVHIIDLDNKTSEVGRYSIADDTIELWTLTEGVGWEKSDITLQLQLGDHPSYTTMLVSVGGKTETYIRMTSQDEHLELWNYDIKPSEGKAVYSYFIEQATLLDWPTLTFELPSIEYFKQLEVFQFTSFPKSFQFSSIPYSQYRIYDEDLELIFEGECATMRSSEQLEFEVPDEDGLYYLEVIANPAYRTSFHSSIFEELAVHYYAAIQVGEEDDDPDTYTPPKSTTDSILIESCDTQPKGAFTLDTTNPVEGEGCWSITTPAAGALAFHAWENGIDASGRDVIEFDLYISDLAALEAMKKNCALELSSSETCDYQEIAFSGEQIVEFGRYGQEWQVGWNHIVLRVADATATNGPGSGSGKEAASFDISNVNFVRFYLLSATTSHTIKIDNICLSVEQK